VKFVLFVEGETEKKVLPGFIRRWLDPKLPKSVGLIAVSFGGWPQYERDIETKARLQLQGKSGGDIIAVIGLLDLYGPTFYPPGKKSVQERYQWAKEHFEKRVGNARFAQHFAVHETEAWLLANRDVFSKEIANALPGKCDKPETVNFDEPPSKLLNRLYRDKLSRRYQKVVEGYNLFQKLEPAAAYDKCPYLRALLDDMLERARRAQNG
jgi:hypothetical protein